VAIVTGAGGGLGRSHALELARRGARVLVNDLGGSVDGRGTGHQAADVVVEEIVAAGGEAIANYDSVASAEGGKAIIDAALDRWGTVDAVINNAGILRDRSFANLTPDELVPVIETHLLGGFYVSQPAFQVMKEKGYGRFVFTASNAGLLGNFGQTNYGAAKMGLVGLSNVIAIEGGKYNIRSNVIAPIARTRMTEDLLGPFAEYLDPGQVTPIVVYLSSENNAYTHEIFSAGGGNYSRFFVGLSAGWFAGPHVTPTVEDLADHMENIRDLSAYRVLGSASEEIQSVAALLQGGT
jgi:NAD(P)-dependent dehydrogenase (short-subunit alcohol dehydrogenase family)